MSIRNATRLRIGSFTPPDGVSGATIGDVTETKGPSGLRALRYVPAEGFEGTALFSYRPIDALGGQGDDVEVRIEVASASDANRAPIARPDAVRTRRDVRTTVPVLVNDVDPDGDDLTLSIVEPLPPGLDVAVTGLEVTVTVRAGADELLPFQYEIDDGRGERLGAQSSSTSSTSWIRTVLRSSRPTPTRWWSGSRCRSTCWRTTSTPTVTRW